MKSNRYIFLLGLLFFNSAKGQFKEMFLDDYLAVNTRSYTSIDIIGTRDSAIVSTYSGRIALRTKQSSKEKVITQLKDEIYGLKYNPLRKEIAAATLKGGVVIVSYKNGKTLKNLPIANSSAASVFYSDDFRFLFANDRKGKIHVWDVEEGYAAKQDLLKNTPNGSLVRIQDDKMTFVTRKNIVVWDMLKKSVAKEYKIDVMSFSDFNKDYILSVNHNECTKFSISENSAVFSVKHPDWLRDTKSWEDYQRQEVKERLTPEGYYPDTNYQMALTSAKFLKDKIITAGIDRSLRVWDATSGKLINSLTGHQATVNKILVNKSQNQVVSIDLNGGIRFWDM